MGRKNISDFQVCMAHILAKEMKFEKWPYEMLSDWTGEPEKVCYRAMERACDKGLIEYGVSLRTGWPTDKGMALLTNESWA